jgi:hypothetical protein
LLVCRALRSPWRLARPLSSLWIITSAFADRDDLRVGYGLVRLEPVTARFYRETTRAGNNRRHLR